jgi:hypothetical protein
MNIHPQKWTMLGINLVGGAAVIGSYLQGLSSHPGSGSSLWGEVPEPMRPVYTVSMLLAAAGYFAFTSFILLRTRPGETRIANRFGFGLFNGLYAGILVPSTLWMPLTYRMMANPSGILWLAIRLTLTAVALCSLGMLGALLRLQPRQPAWAHGIAVAGCIAFCIQTVLLDAVIWSTYFLA